MSTCLRTLFSFFILGNNTLKYILAALSPLGEIFFLTIGLNIYTPVLSFQTDFAYS